MAQIIEHAGGLSAFAGPNKARHGDRDQERDNRDDDHDFDQRKAATAAIKIVKFHLVSIADTSSRAAAKPACHDGNRLCNVVNVTTRTWDGLCVPRPRPLPSTAPSEALRAATGLR